jgi:hypothetical protein
MNSYARLALRAWTLDRIKYTFPVVSIQQQSSVSVYANFGATLNRYARNFNCLSRELTVNNSMSKQR